MQGRTFPSVIAALDFGVERVAAGEHREACGIFKGVLDQCPDNFEAHMRLGSALFELRRYCDALYWFWRGMKLDRRHPLSLTNYGLAIAQLGHWEDGLRYLERARYQADKRDDMSPQVMGLIYNNLGNTLEKLKRYPEALVALDKALTFNADDNFSLYNRGIVLLRLNRHHEALMSLDHALRLRPDDADARYNRSIVRLLLNDMSASAWEDYESRLITTTNSAQNFGCPIERKWLGQDLAGKTLLLMAEQGLGDNIQFTRYVPHLLARGATVKMVVHNNFIPVAKAIEGVTVIESGEPLGDADYWTALMSLPLRLGMNEQIPAPWLPAIEPERVESWRGLVPAGDMPRIGVVWAGNYQHKNDAARSIPLATFARLFGAPAHFVSLQQMRPNDEDTFKALLRKHDNLSALWLEDLRDTAAVISHLDLVISADTAVAHLAASLGKPTFILVPAFGVDWRWQLERQDSPWYPQATLYRQPKVGDWASVITRLYADISAMAARSAAA